MRQLIDLKIDYAFKLIFGKPGNEPILIAFLNATLKLPYESQIKTVTLLNLELNKDYKDDKKSVMDIRAVTNEGIHASRKMERKVGKSVGGRAGALVISTRRVRG